jgi:RNA-directed DNA polymerase
MRSRGLDNVKLHQFKNSLDENLSKISTELRSGTYEFNKLRAHAIKKPGTQNYRPLQIPAVRDRVVMKALALFIEPAFAQFNLDCSFAFIRGRGVNAAINRIRELANGGKKFYFETDILNFFGSVDKSALWQMLSGKIRQRSLLPLLKQCFDLELEDLDGYATEFQKLFLGADSGIPQGGVLSPMLANFYLHEFDRRMLDRGFNLVRYADDFVVMCASEADARHAHQFSENTLRALNLRIHSLDEPNSKSRIGNFSKEGLLFLGIRFEGANIFPAKKAIERFENKVREVLTPESGDNLFKTLQGLRNLIDGWGKCYRTMRVQDIYVRLDEFVRQSVEIYLKKAGIQLLGRSKRRQMRLLGVPSLTAMVQHKESDSRVGTTASNREGTS